ncbi:hypothetical protein P280DRAFT_530833, partial [Massarina eburnea CBS 473.64]
KDILCFLNSLFYALLITITTHYCPVILPFFHLAMVRLIVIAFLIQLFAGVSCLLEFIYPAAYLDGDVSGELIYTKGHSIHIEWRGVEENNATSVVLYQLNMTDQEHPVIGDQEQVTQGTSPSVKAFDWLVGTRKDLSVSSLFCFSIFKENNTESDTDSQYFTIKDIQDDRNSTSSTAMPSPSAAPDKFPTGAIIGIAVGALVLLLLGLGAGFLLSERRKKGANIPTEAPPYHPHVDYQYVNGNYHGPNPNEAAPKPPAQMGELENSYVSYHGQQAKQVVGRGASPVRYEL